VIVYLCVYTRPVASYFESSQSLFEKRRHQTTEMGAIIIQPGQVVVLFALALLIILTMPMESTLKPAIVDMMGLSDNPAQAQILAACVSCTTGGSVGYASSCSEHKHHNDISDYSHWCLTLQCDFHHTKWSVCKLCHERVHRLHQHNGLHPLFASAQNTADTVDGMDDDDILPPDESAIPPPDSDVDDPLEDSSAQATKRPKLSHVKTYEPALSDSHFPQSETMRFFQNEMTNGDGVERLVYRALSNVKDLRETKLSPAELLFHLRNSMHLKGFTKLQREEQSYLLHHGYMANRDTWATRVPVSLGDFDKFYLRSHTSLNKILPYPWAKTYEGHAVNSLIEIVAYALAMEQDIDIIELPRSESDSTQKTEPLKESESVDAIKDSYAFRIMLKRVEIIISEDGNIVSAGFVDIHEWSDDFDPSSVKRNKGSIWIFVVSIGAQQGERNSTHHVYPVALGRKGDSHDAVLEKYNDELEQIKQGMFFYHGGLKRNIKVYGDVHVVGVDRPEKTSLTKSCSHLGHSTKRARCVAAVDGPNSSTFFKHLPACLDCFDRNVKGLPEPEGGCKHCTNWNYFPAGTNNKNLLQEKPRSSYPVGMYCEEIPDLTRKVAKDAEEAKTFTLSPIEITFEFLKASVMFCFYSIYVNKWSVGEGHEFLRLCGLQDESIKEYCTLAYNQRVEKVPIHELKLPDFPPSWLRDVDLFRYIDSPMHLLFLGVVDSTIDLLKIAFSRVSMHAGFARRANGSLEKLRKLSLDFVRAGLFSGNKFTTGSWVSEQYLAFSRVCKSVYGDLDALSAKLSNSDPLVVQMSCVVSSMSAMISRVMTRVVDSDIIKDVDCHIKIFLSAVDRLDRTLHPTPSPDGSASATESDAGSAAAENTTTDSTPGASATAAATQKGKKSVRSLWWFGFTNYLCLLNIPRAMELFGTLILYWEGGGVGEKYLQEVKHLINGGSRPGDQWLVSTLNSVFELKTLRQLISMCESDFEESGDIVEDDDLTALLSHGKKYLRFDSVHIAKSQDELETCASSGFPMSGIVFADGEAEVVLVGFKESGSRIGWLKASFDDSRGAENLCGLWHAPVTLSPYEAPASLSSKAAVKKAAKCCVALLPRDCGPCGAAHDHDGDFCVLGSDWTERGSLGSFSAPCAPIEVFQLLFSMLRSTN